MAIEPTLIATMDCSDLERSIDAYLDGEFDARERAETDQHLEGCPRCRVLADERKTMRDALRAKLREAMAAPAPAGKAPDALRKRIAEALARRRRPLWRRALSPIPISTVAACAAGAMVVLLTHSGDPALVEDAVKSHHRGLPLEVMASVAGDGPILAWLSDKLDFKPVPPHFRTDGMRALGGRLTHVREWPAAYIRYALPKGQAGLFIVNDPKGRFDASGREVRLGQQIIRLGTARGYNVAVWRDHEIVYSLVSDLDEAALYELVRTSQTAPR
ncbi:MAG TPA: zf-HC2 domain-containing protein [Anaeromyxobacter sp.]|nr:zf-HC2 domain-containing protein [Anaeromyxobacter sp.]